MSIAFSLATSIRVGLWAVLTGVIAISAAAYVLYVHDLAAARERLGGRSQLIETRVGTLEYADIGAGQPILVIHGAAGGFDQGLDMTGALADRGFRLIAPSRFGYLRSTMPRNATVAMQADAYVELLDRLGVAKVAIAGISAGAWSALEFAIRHPERVQALVLLVPADYLPDGTSIHGGAIVRSIFNSDFVAWIALKLVPMLPQSGMSRMMLGTDSAVIRAAVPSERLRVEQVLERLLPVSDRRVGMNFDVRTASTRTSFALEKIACPVLIISSEDDRFGTAARARWIAARVRMVKVLIFPTGGHALVGHYADALSESAVFIQKLQAQPPSGPVDAPGS